MRDPRINPRKGDKLAKVTDNRVRSRTVLSVKQGIVTYTPKRVGCQCTLEEWRKWAADASVPFDCKKAAPQGPKAPQDTNVLYAHEFAYQLLAGKNRRIVVLVPSFDAPGVFTAHAPATQLRTIETEQCLVIGALSVHVKTIKPD